MPTGPSSNDVGPHISSLCASLCPYCQERALSTIKYLSSKCPISTSGRAHTENAQMKSESGMTSGIPAASHTSSDTPSAITSASPSVVKPSSTQMQFPFVDDLEATPVRPVDMVALDSNRKDVVMEFEKFGKIARLNRGMVITEKIDGTNGQLLFDEMGMLWVGSRNRWITPENDNCGFARWAHENRSELFGILGEGRHFGEWWGQGIQRRYGMKTKVFSLFNTGRWKGLAELDDQIRCVPVLDEYTFSTRRIEDVRNELLKTGSLASPGFPDPEGVMVFHVAARTMFKYPFEG